MRRVEAVAPVETPALQERLRSLLATCLEDNRQAWDLGRRRRVGPARAEGEVRATHVRLLARFVGPARRTAVRREAGPSSELATRQPVSD